jgi:hypothetical protein
MTRIYFCLLIFINVLSFSKDFGKQHIIKKTPSLFIAEYRRGKDYDIKTYIKRLEVKKIAPFTFEFAVLAPSVIDGDYFSIGFYETNDKKNAPPKDLSQTPDDDVIDRSAGIFFRTFKRDGKSVWAPVIFKKATRIVKDEDHIIYARFFREKEPITGLKGEVVGAPGNFLTYLLSKNLGHGVYRQEEESGFLFPDKKGFIHFKLFLDKKIKKPFFMIISSDHISISKSDRGLRTSIKTNSWN